MYKRALVFAGSHCKGRLYGGKFTYRIVNSLLRMPQHWEMYAEKMI